MRNILLFLLLFIPLFSYSQFTLLGTVVDEQTNEPLIGVTIIIKGTSIGTITEFDGTFELQSEKDTIDLEFSYVSYKKLTMDRIPLIGELTTIPNVRLTFGVSHKF